MGGHRRDRWLVAGAAITNQIGGNGPCNRERIEVRRRAHDEGAWVREAAAYARKRAV